MINDEETKWGNLEIPFLLLVISNSVFSHEGPDTILFKMKYS